MYITDPQQEEDHIATGSESLREFAFNAGMDNPDQCWLLDPRDAWVRNPFYRGPDVRHPEDEPDTFAEDCAALRAQTEWHGNSDGTVGLD